MGLTSDRVTWDIEQFLNDFEYDKGQTVKVGVFKERLNICNECDYLDRYTSRCIKCGCSAPLKCSVVEPTTSFTTLGVSLSTLSLRVLVMKAWISAGESKGGVTLEGSAIPSLEAGEEPDATVRGAPLLAHASGTERRVHRTSGYLRSRPRL